MGEVKVQEARRSSGCSGMGWSRVKGSAKIHTLGEVDRNSLDQPDPLVLHLPHL